MLLVTADSPEEGLPWNISDCALAAARLLDNSAIVMDASQVLDHDVDACLVSSRRELVYDFGPAVPIAKVAIAEGAPGPATSIRLEVRTGPPLRNFRFNPNDFGSAVLDVRDWLEDALNLQVTPEERRLIEVIQDDVASAIHNGIFENVPELAAQLRAIADTLDAQMKAPHPGRPVIGWCLRNLSAIPGGVLGGVAGNYLYQMLPHFTR